MKTCPLITVALALGCSSAGHHQDTPPMTIPHEEPIQAVPFEWEATSYTIPLGYRLDCYIRTDTQPVLEVPPGIRAVIHDPASGLARVEIYGDTLGTYTLTAKVGDFKCSVLVEVAK